MSRYILYRNQKYAEALACIIGAKVCDTEDKLRGINPKDGDIIIVDAHYVGNMYDLNGIQIVKKLQKYECKDKKVKFKILSWFPSEWFYKKSKLQSHKELLYSRHNVEFIQLPVSDVILLS